MHPLLLELGPLRIGSYGLMMALSFIFGWLLARRLGARVAPGDFWDGLCGYLVMFGLLGAKVLLVIVFLPEILREGNPFALLTGGGVWLGGVVGGLIAFRWRVRKERVPAAQALDVLFAVLPFSHALGRLGCFLGGCCYGRPTHLPWAVVYTDPLARELQGTPLGVPLHPYPLYEVLAELLNFAICLGVLRRRATPGAVVATWLGLYGTERFLLEWLRFDARGGYGPFSTSQWISLAMVAVAAAWFYLHRARPPLPVPAAGRRRRAS
jgi:phosphatidylglycerol:prolipoprotein diacylglycerol transferase